MLLHFTFDSNYKILSKLLIFFWLFGFKGRGLDAFARALSRILLPKKNLATSEAWTTHR